MNGGTCFIASPSNSSAGSGGSTPTLLMAATSQPYFNIDMSKISISTSSAMNGQRSMADERKNNIHIRSDSDDPSAELDALFDLSRANRMKPMRLRKLPPSFFSHSPKTVVATDAVKTSSSTSSSILTPQSPLAANSGATFVNQFQPPVVDGIVSPPNLMQLQPPQQNSSTSLSLSQQQRIKNKHLRTRSSPATLEETLAVVPPPELPPSLHHHTSPNSVPGAAASAASPGGSNGPLSPLSSSSSSRNNHRHQPLLLPSRHNNMMLHGHRPLTLAPQPNEEAMCIDAVVDQPPASKSPPSERLASNSRQPHINHSSLHERQRSLPTAALHPDLTLKQHQEQQPSVPATTLSSLPPQHQFSAAAANGIHPQHFHSPSLPTMLQPSSSTTAHIVDNQPLPHGWEMGFTESGQKYFINHVEKTTSWDDPRLMSASVLVAVQKSPPRSNSSVVFAVNGSKNSHVRQMSSPSLLSTVTTSTGTGLAFSLANEEEVPLPDGWEKRVNEHGQAYFVDHINKRTSWEDPRGTLKAEELLPPFQQFAVASNNSSTNTPTPLEVVSSTVPNLRPTNLELTSASTVHGGAQLTTSRQPPVINNHRPLDDVAQQQQQARLRGVLQAEREQMHIRRREHDQKLRVANVANNPNSSSVQLQNVRSTRLIGGGMSEMNASIVVNNDPFLGNNALLNTFQNPQQQQQHASANAGDFHSRQASCDSGLSSAGGCSLPQTPEGLLAQTLDELNLNQQQQQLHFQQYNKLRSARDNNYHHHHQSSLLGNCWPPAPQPAHFFHPQQNPTVHQKSASIDVGCLTGAPSAAHQQRPSTNGGTSSALLSAEDATMLSMASELPEDLSNIDFNDLDSILNPPSMLRNSFPPPQHHGQPPVNSNDLSKLQPSSTTSQRIQQQHRHQRQQAFCE